MMNVNENLHHDWLFDSRTSTHNTGTVRPWVQSKA
jgi:hypothetical protein